MYCSIAEFMPRAFAIAAHGVRQEPQYRAALPNGLAFLCPSRAVEFSRVTDRRHLFAVLLRGCAAVIGKCRKAFRASRPIPTFRHDT